MILLVCAGCANMMLQKCFAYTQETNYSGIAKAMYGNGFEVFVDVIQVDPL